MYLDGGAGLCAEVQLCSDERTDHQATAITRTVLFSDVVASTEILHAHGDAAWLRLVDRHTQAVQSIVAGERGQLGGFLGDGFMVLFDDPGAAVRCALRLRETAARQDPFGIRIGLDHGSVLPYRDDWYVGLTIHIAARLTDRCRAGEVLLSDRCYHAARTHATLPPVVSASTTIKGVDGQLRVHAITARDARSNARDELSADRQADREQHAVRQLRPTRRSQHRDQRPAARTA